MINIDYMKLKCAFLSCLLLSLVAHGYFFFNFLCSHDSLYTINSYDILEHLIRLGRFMRPVYFKIFGSFETPVLIGFLQLIFLTCAVYFLIELLKIKSKIQIFIISGIAVTNYSITLLNATYLHDAAAYALSFLLVVLGVYLSVNSQSMSKTVIVLYAVSMGLYQCYIQCSVVILEIILLQRLLKNNNQIEVFLRFRKNFLEVILGGGLYYLIHKVILKLTGIQESLDYNGLGNIGGYNIEILLRSFRTLFEQELEWLMFPLNYHQKTIAFINIILVIFVVMVMMYIIKKCPEKRKIVLPVVTLLSIILSMNFIAIISKGMVHHLMTYSFFLVYLLPIVMSNDLCSIYQSKKTIFAKRCVVVLLCIWCFDNVIYSNTIYLKKELENKATFAIVNRMIDRIEQTEGYEIGKTKVAIIGNINKSLYAKRIEGLRYNGTGERNVFAITYYGTYDKYFNTYLSSTIRLLSESEMNKLSTMKKVKEMPIFPDKGSCKNIDGIVILKISK